MHLSIVLHFKVFATLIQYTTMTTRTTSITTPSTSATPSPTHLLLPPLPLLLVTRFLDCVIFLIGSAYFVAGTVDAMQSISNQPKYAIAIDRFYFIFITKNHNLYECS